MTTEDLRTRLETLSPGTQADVTDFSGENNHFKAVIVSPAFQDKTPVEQHRMVFGLLKEEMASNEVHALTLKTFTSKVEQIVKQNPAVIFMKGTLENPQCGFSKRAAQVMQEAGARDLFAVNVLADDPLWDALEAFTQWNTVPQIFIQGQFVGGHDIVVEMHERGELRRLLQER